MARTIRDPQSRERIVRAAWRLVADGGIRAATIRAIAAESDVTTGSVTHYFEDKAEVMSAVLEYNNAQILRRMSDVSRDLRGLGAVRAYALALMPTDADAMAVWRVWLAFWASDKPSAQNKRTSQRGWHEWRDSMRARLGEAVADGELPDGLDLGYEADRIGTLMAGMVLVFAPVQRRRKQVSARALRMLDDHLAHLADR